MKKILIAVLLFSAIGMFAVADFLENVKVDSPSYQEILMLNVDGVWENKDKTALFADSTYFGGKVVFNNYAYFDSTAEFNELVLIDSAEIRIVNCDTLFVEDIFGLYDTDLSNYLQLKWNEDDTADRVLNILVQGADRTLTLYENLTVGDGYDLTITADNAASAIVMDNANLEVENTNATQRNFLITSSKAGNTTLTFEEDFTVADGNAGSILYSAASKTLTVEDNVTVGLDVNALEGLSGTGLVARTGANAYSERTITGTANEVEVSNGDGVSGNPTIGLPDDVVIGDSLYVGGNTRFASELYIPNNTSFNARNAANSAWDALFKYNTSNQVEAQQDWLFDVIEFEEDAGAVTAMNMPVSSTPIDGDEMSMTFSIDSNPVLKVRGSADGSGGADDFIVEVTDSLYVGGNANIDGGAIYLKETTTPSAVADYGAIYTKSDNTLYFQDGAGTEHSLVGGDEYYGEFYWNANSNATTIETANTPIMLRETTTGLVNGWTYNAGSTGAITVYADYSGTVAGATLVTSNTHNLATGDHVSIRGTTNYNGIHEVTVVDANTFYIVVAFVADDGASDWDEGSYLECDTGSGGIYQIDYTLSITEGGGAGSDVTTQIYKNDTACTKCAAKRKFANNDYGAIGSGAVFDVSDGDRIYLTATSSGTNTLTIQYGNIRLHRD